MRWDEAIIMVSGLPSFTFLSPFMYLHLIKDIHMATGERRERLMQYPRKKKNRKFYLCGQVTSHNMPIP
jgi:hypothetical protein